MVDNTLINLIGNQTQLLVEVGDFAEILYWGQPVKGELVNFRQSLYRPVPYGRLDTDIAMTLSPELGRGG